jgi:hypothetical protein
MDTYDTTIQMSGPEKRQSAGGAPMSRLAFMLIAIPLLLATGCSGSDIAGKAGWPGWPDSRETMTYNEGNGP